MGTFQFLTGSQRFCNKSVYLVIPFTSILSKILSTDLVVVKANHLSFNLNLSKNFYTRLTYYFYYGRSIIISKFF